jgi:tRNA-specific 2-thiouridylase
MADGVGAAKIATGHYARLSFDEATGRYQMRTGIDASKDQTYFLFGLTQAQLARTLFPLGGMVKKQVRELAKELKLPVAEKNDSQEICFVPNGDYAVFIDAYFREKGLDPAVTKGNIVDTSGRVWGEHTGTHHYTVGQRRGLRVAAGEPLYVIATDPKTQRVIVGRNDELLRGTLTATDANWISISPPEEPVRAVVKIRNKHVPAPATLVPTGDHQTIEVRFDQPQRAVTPGQAAVFYQDDLVLGGGWIS